MATYEEQMKDLEARKKAFMAKVTEQNKAFDEEFNRIKREERERKQKAKNDFLESLTRDIAHDYGMSFEQSRIIVDQAWERGHSSGTLEVKSYAHEYGGWVEKILNMQREMDY